MNDAKLQQDIAYMKPFIRRQLAMSKTVIDARGYIFDPEAPTTGLDSALDEDDYWSKVRRLAKDEVVLELLQEGNLTPL